MAGVLSHERVRSRDVVRRRTLIDVRLRHCDVAHRANERVPGARVRGVESIRATETPCDRQSDRSEREN